MRDDTFQWLSWLQTLLAAATAALVFTALRPVSRWLALAGAAAFALNPSVLVYQTILEPEIVQVFLVTALLGLSFLTRGTFLPFAAVVPLLYRVHPGGARTWARESLHFAAPLAAAVLLLSARNGMLTGRFAPVAANPGTVFFEGNNPSSLGASAAYLPLVEELGTKPGEVDYQHAGYRAVALNRLGRTEEAAAALVESMRLGIDAVAYEEDGIAILRRWSAGRADDPEARYFLGVALHQYGRFREALAVLEDVRRQLPHEVAVQEQIAVLLRILAASSP